MRTYLAVASAWGIYFCCSARTEADLLAVAFGYAAGLIAVKIFTLGENR